MSTPESPESAADGGGAHAPRPSRTSRRRFLTGAGAGAAALTVTGATAERADAATFVDHSMEAVAAFAVPGNDRYSRQQRLTHPGHGGVDAMGGRVLRETLDSAIPLTVSRAGELPAPGALGVALLLESLALHLSPFAVFGPFASPFANLRWTQKRWVLQQLDVLPLLKKASIEYAGGAIVTLAAMGAYSERAVFDRASGELRGRPLGWEWSNYGGVSDGWDELIGYYQGRTEVSS